MLAAHWGLTMIDEHMVAAIAGATSTAQLDELARTVWGAFGQGQIGEGAAATLSEAIEKHRRTFGTPRRTPGFTPRFKRGNRYPPRDRGRSLERRRRLAASGPMPPALASMFTCGELAVLRIVADEMRDSGGCDRSLGELAARAGVGRTTAQNAIRRAAREGLLSVRERPQIGRRNLPNVVTVVSREWLLWIERGRAREPIGFKNPHPTDRPYIQRKKPQQIATRSRAGDNGQATCQPPNSSLVCSPIPKGIRR